jgi:hypothetical protein
MGLYLTETDLTAVRHTCWAAHGRESEPSGSPANRGRLSCHPNPELENSIGQTRSSNDIRRTKG